MLHSSGVDPVENDYFCFMPLLCTNVKTTTAHFDVYWLQTVKIQRKIGACGNAQILKNVGRSKESLIEICFSYRQIHSLWKVIHGAYILQMVTKQILKIFSN